MANKKFHAVARWVHGFSPWYLLALASVFGIISVIALRQNNLTMVQLRDQVFQADKQNGDVEGALRTLREFVYSHMNTDLSSGTGVKPPIQLKYTYDRLVTAEHNRVAKINGDLYKEAQRYCEATVPFGLLRLTTVPCAQKYLKEHPGAKEQTIPDALYKFDFVSPTWTPDLAGLSLAAAILLLILFAGRYGIELWVKHDLKNST